MNRAERREREKANKKESNKKVEALAWFRSLPETKRVLIDSLIKIEAKKDNESLIQAIDRCFTAAIIQEFDFLEWNEIEQIIDVSAELMMDDVIKTKKMKEKTGGNYDMAMKKINEMSPAVEKRIRELIKDGYNQKSSVKMLVEEFRELSTAMLTNAYKKTKSLVADEQKIKTKVENEALEDSDKEIDNAVKYILEDNNEEDKKEVIEGHEDDELEIVNEIRILDIKGKFGNYHVENAIVEFDEMAFMNKSEINSWASEKREKIAKEIAILKSKINEITEKEEEIIKVMNKFV